jgi:C1A family cysteine protease
MGEMIGKGMGWLPDYPDFRDYTVERNEVAPGLQLLGQKYSVNAMLEKAGVAELANVSLPGSVDLKAWCSPIEDQGNLGSCTAHAGVGIVEYYERRAFGKHIDASRLFLYKATRNMMHLTGDTGAYLRTTMGALVLFGVPPEDYWQYEIADFDEEPPAFCYAFAQSYHALSYYRLDPFGTAKAALLSRIKADLAAGLPAMFGFTVYSSISQASQAATPGEIPFPTPGEERLGGHAIVAVGYDEKKKIRNTNPGAVETKGALLIRNSWGTGWGSGGYGWLPYDYVSKGLAVDWWSLLKNEWIETGMFRL